MSEKKVKPVKIKKRTSVGNFIEAFLTDLFDNILVPGAERMASNMISETFDVTKRAVISTISKNPQSQNDIYNSSNIIPYTEYFYRKQQPNMPVPKPTTYTVADYAYNNIILKSQGEAEWVLSELRKVLEQRRFARVSDLYLLVDVTPSPTDFNYGWTDLQSAKVVMSREGYWIKLPKAMPID